MTLKEDEFKAQRGRPAHMLGFVSLQLSDSARYSTLTHGARLRWMAHHDDVDLVLVGKPRAVVRIRGNGSERRLELGNEAADEVML